MKKRKLLNWKVYKSTLNLKQKQIQDAFPYKIPAENRKCSWVIQSTGHLVFINSTLNKPHSISACMCVALFFYTHESINLYVLLPCVCRGKKTDKNAHIVALYFRLTSTYRLYILVKFSL